MSCGRRHPKHHKFAHRARTPRLPFRQGPKNWRRLFLNEMRRSNNIVRAIAHAKIRWITYTEWLESGFLSQAMLDEAEHEFHRRHPNVDMLATLQTDQELEAQGIGAAAVEATTATVVQATPAAELKKVYLELHGYSAEQILSSEGWSNADEYEIDNT